MNPAPPVTRTFTIVARPVIDTCSPPNPHFRVVAEHEPVRGGFHRYAMNPDVPADETVRDATGVADHAALEHDAVLDFRVADLGPRADGRERSHVRMHDPRARADDHGSADDRALDRRAGVDHHLALDA